MKSNSVNRSPLVILEFDAGDPDLIERWVAEGYLPNFAALMNRGCWARTAGPETICEHGTRLSMWSGRSRREHGYYAIRQLCAGSYELEAWNSHHTSIRPFWSELHDRNVAIIDAPECYPLPGLRGIQLSDWTTLMPDISRFEPATEPAVLLEEVTRVFGPKIEFREFRPNQSFAEDVTLHRAHMARVAKHGALCRHLLGRDRFDFIVAGFYEAHATAHQCWQYRPEAPQGGKSELTNAIRDVYQATDREMGRILEQLPAEANVFILSPFGMRDGYPINQVMDEFCRKLGYQAAPPSVPASPSPLALARRLIPESWRVAISQRLPRAMQERLLADRARTATDWSRTTAFSIPTLYTGCVRINLRGREPQGIVAPGAEYEAVLARLEADFKQLIDPATQQPAVARTMRTVDLYGSVSETLPDLFIEWQPLPSFRAEVIHPRAVLHQQRPWYYRDNEHTGIGIFAAAGPGIHGRGRLPDVAVLDFAPTFLRLLGEPIPHKMTGTPCRALLEP